MEQSTPLSLGEDYLWSLPDVSIPEPQLRLVISHSSWGNGTGSLHIKSSGRLKIDDTGRGEPQEDGSLPGGVAEKKGELVSLWKHTDRAVCRRGATHLGMPYGRVSRPDKKGVANGDGARSPAPARRQGTKETTEVATWGLTPGKGYSSHAKGHGKQQRTIYELSG